MLISYKLWGMDWGTPFFTEQPLGESPKTGESITKILARIKGAV